MYTVRVKAAHRVDRSENGIALGLLGGQIHTSLLCGFSVASSQSQIRLTNHIPQETGVHVGFALHYYLLD